MPRRKKPDWCLENKEDCFAYSRSGLCRACVETDFEHGCPFYKTALQRKKEHLASVQYLEEQFKFDLIRKYGEIPDTVWNEI